MAEIPPEPAAEDALPPAGGDGTPRPPAQERVLDITTISVKSSGGEVGCRVPDR